MLGLKRGGTSMFLRPDLPSSLPVACVLRLKQELQLCESGSVSGEPASVGACRLAVCGERFELGLE